MSKNKLLHTKGKWDWNDNPLNEAQILITRGVTFISLIEKREANNDEEAKSNAERIVTCVNAMQGLSNEEVKELRDKLI